MGDSPEAGESSPGVPGRAAPVGGADLPVAGGRGREVVPYVEAYESGVSFRRFLEEVRATPELWRAIARRTTVGGEYLDRVRRSGGPWRLLVLADDWCGDAVNSLPVIARLVEAHPEAELRIVPRDAFPEIRDRHLTNGARSIPIAILLDGEGKVAWELGTEAGRTPGVVRGGTPRTSGQGALLRAPALVRPGPGRHDRP